MAAMFAEGDDDFDEAEKMNYIEKCCAAAETVIQSASDEGILFDIITKWNQPKIVSYEMTVLEREGMLSGEEGDEDD